ncbi:MAG: carboxypeptidase regulatory-like domain-containing protein [Kofleriaceae bacterium]
MPAVRFVAFVVFVGLVSWLIWPDPPSSSAVRRDAPSTTPASATSSTKIRGTTEQPALSTDDDGNVILPEDEAADRIRVEGVVLDEKKAAIGRAIVRYRDRETMTEVDGTFAFDDIASGAIILRAEKDEWYGEESTYVSDTSDPIEITVRRGSTLVLRVVKRSDKTPIANAKVEIAYRELYTNDRGMLRTRGLDPTGERFTVSADGFGTWRGDLELDTERPTAEKEMTVELASGAPVGGIVVDERGDRVSEAYVSIRAVDGSWSDSTYANDRGEFTLPAIAPGKHTMYGSSKTHIATPEMLIEHGARPKTDVVVKVQLGAELAGRVVDTTGRPVAGATVRGAGVETDADGRFVALGLEPGELVISAYLETRASEETKVTIATGKRVDVKLVVRDSSLAGRVVDKKGNPVADAQLWAMATDESNTFFASADEYGAFDFGGIPPGDYNVIAQHEEEASRRLPDTKSVFRTGRRDLTIVLPALASVTGRVVLDGVPVGYFGVIVTKTPERRYAERTTTVNDERGVFVQRDIAPGTWSVIVLGPGFATKTIDGVVGDEGRTTDLGTIVVERGRVVRGRVTDGGGRPVHDALVVAGESLFSLASNRVEQRSQGDTSARTDADGRYELVGLQAEELKIAARTPRARSVERTLGVDETVVDLVVEEVGSVVGTIANVRTSQIGVVLSLAGEDALTYGPRYHGDIDRAGDYRVENVPPGRYTVRVMGENTLPEKEVDVASNTTSRVDFELPVVQIEVTVQANDCSLVYLVGPDMRTLGTCSNNNVTWQAVGPGSYKVCDSIDDETCTVITVSASPSAQRFEVRFPATD